MKDPAPRLAVVLSHPTQYYSPWFRWMAENAPLALRVFYLWNFGVTHRRDPHFGTVLRWDVDLLSGYDHEFVPNIARDPGTHHFRGLRNPLLPARLDAWRPQAVLIFGHGWESSLRALFWAWRRRVPALFRGDSHFLARPVPGRLRGLPLRLLLRRFAAVTYVGAANRRYFQALGVPDSRLFFAPHAVDHTRFQADSRGVRSQAAALRVALGLRDEDRVVLFAGKLVAAKQPGALLAAFLELEQPGTALVFVGDGEQRLALEEQARARPGARVRFLPFANQSEMPARYALADLFVLPSRGAHESWGLAVNEAMHLGVPALVSDVVGCAEDLVTPGETGWVFPAADPAALRAQLDEALRSLADPGRRAALGEAAKRRAANYTYPQTTEGLLRALRHARPGAGGR
jgi:glycosyltransferase involved in cell wall biosynthesis